MKLLPQLLLTVVLAPLLSGCISPQYTRLPTLAYGDPRMERRAYEFHDPLPDSDSSPTGSMASVRPRGFDIQRTEQRRALERAYNPVPFDADGNTSGFIPSAARYPHTVQP